MSASDHAQPQAELCNHLWVHHETTFPTRIAQREPPGNYTTETVTLDRWYCQRCRAFEWREREELNTEREMVSQ